MLVGGGEFGEVFGFAVEILLGFTLLGLAAEEEGIKLVVEENEKKSMKDEGERKRCGRR